MKKLFITLLTASLFVGTNLSSVFAADSAKEVLDDRVREVNRSAKDQGLPMTLKRISTETGVPHEQVQSMHKSYPDVGPAGLMIACVLANDTKKEPETFLKRHASGKSWTSIARDNNVPLDRLNSRLDRLDTAIGESDSKDTKRKHKEK